MMKQDAALKKKAALGENKDAIPSSSPPDSFAAVVSEELTKSRELMDKRMATFLEIGARNHEIEAKNHEIEAKKLHLETRKQYMAELQLMLNFSVSDEAKQKAFQLLQNFISQIPPE